jgi:RNA-binding protein
MAETPFHEGRGFCLQWGTSEQEFMRYTTFFCGVVADRNIQETCPAVREITQKILCRWLRHKIWRHRQRRNQTTQPTLPQRILLTGQVRGECRQQKLKYEGYRTMQKLTGKQVRFLRGLGHHLNPIVMVGKEDVSPKVLVSIEEALQIHELIKIRIQDGCMLDRKEVAAIISKETSAAIVQILGKTLIFYRAGDEKKIELP